MCCETGSREWAMVFFLCVAELAGRGITATIAAGKSSYIGTCLASPVAWIFATVLLWVMYFYVMKDMARKLYGTNKL